VIGAIALVAGLCLAAWTFTTVAAQELPPDQACILCHAGADEVYTFPSGETMPVGVQLDTLEQSVHGDHAAADVYCTDCHVNPTKYRYPHLPNPAQTVAEFGALTSQNCETCHTPLELHNPGHLQAADNPNLPACADCHGGHDVQPVDHLPSSTVAFCQSCHQTYADPHVGEVHAELVANMTPNQDCLVCHGEVEQTEDEKCKTCHSMLTGDMVLSSGEAVNLYVDPNHIVASVHGERIVDGVQYGALQCTDCHEDQGRYGFPHAPLTEETQRELTIDMERACQSCHQDIYDQQQAGVHHAAVVEGQPEAAACSDCHGNHLILDPSEPRAAISDTCGKCHSTINEQYAHSVHGAALLGEDNPDVPVCTDCHGVHDIESPQTAEFRVNSPTLCAGCHADEEMMAKYGISTDVFDTYVADFHGTTATLFEQTDPSQEVNAAVCYDCHGVHNILPATDENSQVLKQNLLTTCQQCHPNANENFPASWMSHFPPSLEHYPVVYLVDLFYTLLIPGLVGGFLLFIGTDVVRRVVDRRQSRKQDKA
jgi:predicted CXXCH cytochrome family protein